MRGIEFVETALGEEIGNVLIGKEESEKRLEELKRSGAAVPSGFGAEDLMEAYNYVACREYPEVIVRGRRVPRACVLEEHEMALIMQEAKGWEEVRDLADWVAWMEFGGDEGDLEARLYKWIDERV